MEHAAEDFVDLRCLDSFVLHFLNGGTDPDAAFAQRVRDAVISGESQLAHKLLQHHPSDLLRDQRLRFKMKKQYFLDLVAEASPASLSKALEVARSDLAPLALDAYPEAYAEFKHSMLSLLCNPAQRSKEETTHLAPTLAPGSVCAAHAEHAEEERCQLAGMLHRTLRETLGVEDPPFSVLLRYLLLVHIQQAQRGEPSPQGLRPAQPGGRSMRQSGGEAGQGAGARTSDGCQKEDGGAGGECGAEGVAAACRRLVLEGSDPPPLPPEHSGAPTFFPEARVQALRTSLGVKREEAVALLRRAGGDVHAALRCAVQATRVDEPAVRQLAQEYALFRGLDVPVLSEDGPPPGSTRGHPSHRHPFAQEERGTGPQPMDLSGSGNLPDAMESDALGCIPPPAEQPPCASGRPGGAEGAVVPGQRDGSAVSSGGGSLSGNGMGEGRGLPPAGGRPPKASDPPGRGAGPTLDQTCGWGCDGEGAARAGRGAAGHAGGGSPPSKIPRAGGRRSPSDPSLPAGAAGEAGAQHASGVGTMEAARQHPQRAQQGGEGGTEGGGARGVDLSPGSNASPPPSAQQIHSLVRRVRGLLQSGRTEEAEDLLCTLSGSFPQNHPRAVFLVRRCGFLHRLQLDGEGERAPLGASTEATAASSALAYLRSRLAPLATQHPQQLQPLLKACTAALMGSATSAADLCDAGVEAAAAVRAALQRQYSIPPPRLLRLLGHLLVTHSVHFMEQRCSDGFQDDMGVADVRGPGVAAAAEAVWQDQRRGRLGDAGTGTGVRPGRVRRESFFRDRVDRLMRMVERIRRPDDPEGGAGRGDREGKQQLLCTAPATRPPVP